MLNRTPNLQNILFGERNESVGFDCKLRDHRKRIGILHDEVGLLRVDVTPAIVSLFKNVGGGERVTRTQRGILYERRYPAPWPRSPERTAGSVSDLTRTKETASSAASFDVAATAATGSP